MSSSDNLQTAQARIADCLQLDAAGNLVQRRDHLNLAGLDLTDADLSKTFDFPERGLLQISLADLPHLKYLDLTGNALTELPACVAGFADLVWLGLNFNRLAALPGEMGGMKKLQRLYLRGNPLSELPIYIGSLTSLVELDLTGCAVARLPSSMAHLTELRHIALEAKPLEADLRAAWKKKDWATLRRHLMSADEEALNAYRKGAHYQTELQNFGEDGPRFAELVAKATSMHGLRLELEKLDIRAELFPSATKDGGLEFLGGSDMASQCVGKVVLVGSQEHGKTCLQRALRGEPFIKGYKSTDGMSRERLHLTLAGEHVPPAKRTRMPGPQEDIIDLTLWDMGGQDKYQHTHQMFFTPSAVYLVATLPRQGGEVQKLDEWIGLVKRRTGGEATVIVVSTCCSTLKADKSLTLEDLRARHGGMIRAVISVDSSDGTGISELRKLLAAEVQEPRAKCRHTWLPGWAGVLDELSNRKEAFLRWPQIEDICQQHGIKDAEERRQVVRTGHYTGALLWREDIPAGEDVVILNPDWLSRAVARLLDDEVTQKAHGLVDTRKLARVWRDPGRDETPGYEPDTYPALIELMEINELAYRPKGRGKATGDGDLLLVTQMVVDMPAQDVEKTWQTIGPKDGVDVVRVIAFRKLGDIEFGEVPDIIYLLIFRMRDFSLGREDYDKAVHWQRGLLVMDSYGSAGRIELDGSKLRVIVRHRLGDGLMHSIVHRIGMRDDEHWNGRGLEMEEYVPCGGACKRGTPGAGLISMEKCVKSDLAGNKSVDCSTCGDFLPIHALLGQKAVEPVEAAQLREWMKLLMDELQAGKQMLFAEVQKQGVDTRERVSELRQQVQMQGDGILDAFTSEWKDGPRLFSLIPVPGNGWNPKTWTEMTFRVTVWCESCRKPVPFFGRKKRGEKGAGEFKGSETITLSREWVQKARKFLTWGSWAALAVATGGAAGVGGLVAASGNVISPDEADELSKELAKQQKTLKEVIGSIPDETRHMLRQKRDVPDEDETASFSMLGRKAYGAPEQEDLALVRFLREEFKKKDPTWGGLVPRDNDKFGRIWAHPESNRM